jgi:hypothetical protein
VKTFLPLDRATTVAPVDRATVWRDLLVKLALGVTRGWFGVACSAVMYSPSLSRR